MYAHTKWRSFDLLQHRSWGIMYFAQGAKKERKGEENRKKGEEEREKRV